MKHTEPHPLARQTVTLNEKAVDAAGEVVAGTELVVEDWWDALTGKSWMFSDGNPAALKYAMRTGMSGGSIPLDDEVVYGKIGSFGHLVHVSELGDPVGATN
jgi:hypothetical protein